MADNDAIGAMSDDELGDEAIGGVKEKRPSFLPVLLKWIAIGIAVMIFIFAISAITYEIMSKRGKGLSEYPTSVEYRDTREVLSWYSDGSFSTLTNDGGSAQVDVSLGYSSNDKTASQELSERRIEIRDFLRNYFSSKDSAELRGMSNEENIKIEIRNLINDNILSKSKIKSVKFTQYNILSKQE